MEVKGRWLLIMPIIIFSLYLVIPWLIPFLDLEVVVIFLVMLHIPLAIYTIHEPDSSLRYFFIFYYIGKLFKFTCKILKYLDNKLTFKL